jgi:hypothetical protein
MNESYQDKVDRSKTGYQPVIDGPLLWKMSVAVQIWEKTFLTEPDTDK